MKKITSIAHAQEVLGTLINFDNFPAALASVGIPEKDIAPQIANYSLWLITEANNKLNNWDNKKHNPKQEKYSIWAPYIVAKADRPSGFGLAFCLTNCWCTDTFVGARLEVGSAGETKYIFEDFNDLYDLAWLFQEEK
jgi:hypothetical protein